MEIGPVGDFYNRMYLITARVGLTKDLEDRVAQQVKLYLDSSSKGIDEKKFRAYKADVIKKYKSIAHSYCPQARMDQAFRQVFGNKYFDEMKERYRATLSERKLDDGLIVEFLNNERVKELARKIDEEVQLRTSPEEYRALVLGWYLEISRIIEERGDAKGDLSEEERKSIYLALYLLQKRPEFTVQMEQLQAAIEKEKNETFLSLDQTDSDAYLSASEDDTESSSSSFESQEISELTMLSASCEYFVKAFEEVVTAMSSEKVLITKNNTSIH